MIPVTGHVSYTYAVARPAQGLADALAAVRGVADAPVRLLEGPGTAALVSHVAAEGFDEDSLKRQLEDLEWLEQVARAHHLVVEAASAVTTVLPLRLATIYRDDDRVREVLAEGEKTFGTLLGRLDGRVEWGVKLYVVPPPAEAARGSSAAPEAPETPEAAARAAPDVSPGRAYLRGRRKERHAREDAWRTAEEAARRVEAEARHLAVDRARHRLQQGDLARGPGQNVLNDAYLVPRALGEDFRTRMSRVAGGLVGVRLQVTGPWAPYSFATPPEEPAEYGERRTEQEAYGQ